MKKLIFLDFDGVITTLKSGWKLDPEKLELLGRILEGTGAELVISSSWRSHTIESTIAILKDKNRFFNGGIEFPFCDKIIGVTKRLLPKTFKSQYCRGDEIDLWLKENTNEPVKYLILDDDRDFLPHQMSNFRNTHWETGLSEEDVQFAIEFFK